MRSTLLALAFAAASLPAQAAECVYWNAFNDDTVSFTADGTELARMVKGGAIITCKMEENTYAHGPFPATCTNGETSWDGPFGWFPDASGEVGALLMFSDLIWYRRCS